jgi:uncharacterized protein YeaO (DUF488 family)
MQHDIRIKRIYLPAEAGDGWRVLADRLWPRGISKDRAALGLWAREAAPSDALRRWYGHDADKFAAFRDAYIRELDKSEAASALARECREKLDTENVTLLFAAKDAAASNAEVLRQWLSSKVSAV